MSRRGTYLAYTTATPPVAQPSITANGNYLLKIKSGPQGADLIDWQGGKGSLEVMGTFDSASVQLQMLGLDGATWLNIGAAITANTLVNFEAPAGQLRVTVASIVTASALTIGVVGIPTNNGG